MVSSPQTRPFLVLMEIETVYSKWAGIVETLWQHREVRIITPKVDTEMCHWGKLFGVGLWIGRLWQNYIHVTWIHLLSSFTCFFFLTCLENDILRFSLALTRCGFLMEDTSAGLQFKANKPVKLRKAIALLQMVAMSWKTH